MNYLAIDIGGTDVKVAIINAEGIVQNRMRCPTPRTSYEDLMTCLDECVQWGLGVSTLAGIALSQPCVTDAQSGEAISEGALIYIKNQNPAKDLENRYGIPTAAENDGNCAALAELWIGGAKDLNHIALIVSGTGIGGAVVINREIISGHKLFSGEFGMIITEHSAEGRPMTWSECGSTQALVKQYAALMDVEESSLNGKIVFDRADAGDLLAKQCVDQYFKRFAIGIHNIQHVYDPELILIGGAVSARVDFLHQLHEKMTKLYSQMDGLMSQPDIAICACGADANLIGAVYHLIRQKGDKSN